MRTGSLCTGYAGLDLAVEAVLGAAPAWVCDLDPGAAALLAHNYPQLPNYHDLTATDWSTVEPVDVMTAGWPCQPWSNAGRRKGTEDERAIWPAVADAIRIVRPRLVVLENVSAIARAGELARAVAHLAALGYVGSWRCLRAADVGAPHRRERIFIVAADTRGEARPLRAGLRADGPAGLGRPRPDDRRVVAAYTGEQRRVGWPGEQRTRWNASVGSETSGDSGDGCGAPTADAEGLGRGERRAEPARLIGGSDVALGGDAAPDADRIRQERHAPTGPRQGVPQGECGADRVDWGTYQPVIDRWAAIVGRDAPAPTVLGKRGGRQLSPWFVEWMMGLSPGHVTDVPGLSRNQQLKLLGNGVVPQQAAHAIRLLLPALLDRAVAA